MYCTGVVARAAAQLADGLFNLVMAVPAPKRLRAKHEQLRQVRIQSVGAAGGISCCVGQIPIRLGEVYELVVTTGELRPRLRGRGIQIGRLPETRNGGFDWRPPARGHPRWLG